MYKLTIICIYKLISLLTDCVTDSYNLRRCCCCWYIDRASMDASSHGAVNLTQGSAAQPPRYPSQVPYSMPLDVSVCLSVSVCVCVCL